MLFLATGSSRRRCYPPDDDTAWTGAMFESSVTVTLHFRHFVENHKLKFHVEQTSSSSSSESCDSRPPLDRDGTTDGL
ncbi:hypothetical protein F2P81_019722 [Scophthalmus maximus]|uniref:Uncharacterized protein n=1 Tax=Scophthalmus maximus TaxID=52904 RepID=A0A6A4S8L4_SCOMX|nr:hypothetical protein F2P81_019722 [Scophthalmus maximus]